MDWTTIIISAAVPTVLGLAGLIVGLKKSKPDAAATLTGAALKMVENAQSEGNEAKAEARAIRTEMQILALNFHKLQRSFEAEKARADGLEHHLRGALAQVGVLKTELIEERAARLRDQEESEARINILVSQVRELREENGQLRQLLQEHGITLEE